MHGENMAKIALHLSSGQNLKPLMGYPGRRERRW